MLSGSECGSFDRMTGRRPWRIYSGSKPVFTENRLCFLEKRFRVEFVTRPLILITPHVTFDTFRILFRLPISRFSWVVIQHHRTCVRLFSTLFYHLVASLWEFRRRLPARSVSSLREILISSTSQLPPHYHPLCDGFSASAPSVCSLFIAPVAVPLSFLIGRSRFQMEFTRSRDTSCFLKRL